MKARNSVTALLMALVMVAVAGCAVQPKTPAASLGYVYASINSVANQTDEAFQRGAISREQATEVAAVLNRAHELADSAGSMIDAGNPRSAQERIDMANNLLLEVEKRLQREVEGNE